MDMIVTLLFRGMTSSTLMVFTLAMVENPHMWKRVRTDSPSSGTDRRCHTSTQLRGKYSDGDRLRRRTQPSLVTPLAHKPSAHTHGAVLLLGRHIANASAWSAIVTMLAILDFNSVKDVNGNDITFTHGIAERPVTPPPDVKRDMLFDRLPLNDAGGHSLASAA
ncbi:hypothetical protein EV363DRAFT_1316871 [Boletus edulis]|nr:hypothetical protein EV363DRAFT_1316871 [Boletus edulis]